MQRVTRLLTKNRIGLTQLIRTTPKFRFSVSEIPRLNTNQEPKSDKPDDKKDDPKDEKGSPFPKNPKDAWRWLKEQFYTKANPENPVLWLAGWAAIFTLFLGFYLYEAYLEEQKISMNVG
jgi:hypothetical protein